MENEIEHLVQLDKTLRNSAALEEKITATSNKNPWFIPAFLHYAIDAVIKDMLDEAKLNQWLNKYSITPVDKTIGMVFAGNVPLVGFHDFLCCYVAGCKMKIKLSSKDDQLFPFILGVLRNIDKSIDNRVEIVETLKNFDAVIATGTDNTNRTFEYYFRNYPKILRHNRNSVAILTGKETPEELRRLSDDIFLYFGFGCRNVSKLYVPRSFDFASLFNSFSNYAWLHNHNKYLNNYDYNRTLLLLNKTPHFSNDFVILVENNSIPSPIATVHYEFWDDEENLKAGLQRESGKIQCVVSSAPQKWPFASSVEFGQAQHPELWDYADGVDTLEFLLRLQ